MFGSVKILLVCLLLQIFIQRGLNHRPEEKINKSYEIFEYSNLLKQRTSFKLKCEFADPNQKGLETPDNNNDVSTNNNNNTASRTRYVIRWFKLDEKDWHVLDEYSVDKNKFSLNAENFSNIFVKDESQSSSSARANSLFHLNDAKYANLGRSSKLASSLLFRYKNSNEVNMANGVYLCKVDESPSPDSNKHGSQRTLNHQHADSSASKLKHFQTIQKITVNELINQNDMIFRLNYTMVQVTSSRVIVELKPLNTFNQEINTKSRLIYSLLNANTKQAVARGQIDMTSQDTDAHANLKRYLIIESLNANLNYTLLIYLKTRLNLNSNYVQLAANQTFATLGNNPNASTSPSSSADDDYDDDEDDEDDEDDYDEYLNLDAGNQHRRSSDEYAADQTPSKRIINCELIKKPNDPYNLIKHRSSFKSNSLFAESKKAKVKSQLLTINYSAQNLNKLNLLILNRTSSPLTNVNDFKDFFHLIRFAKGSLDFSTYYDCLKQIKQTSTSRLSNDEPLCLFNFETNTNGIENEPDYDEYFDTSNVQSDDLFSVQSSFVLNRHALVYVASSCQKRKRPIRNSNQFAALSLRPTPSTISKFKYIPNEAKTPSTVAAAAAAASRLTKQTEQSNPQQQQQQQQSMIKKQHQQQQLLTLYQQQHLANINQCIMDNENEIEFQIENKLREALKGTASSAPNSFDYTPYYYHIEILIPDLIEHKHVNAKNGLKIPKTKFRALSSTSSDSFLPVWIKFQIKIENSSTQVVKVNISNIYGENTTTNNNNNIKIKSKSTKLINNDNRGETLIEGEDDEVDLQQEGGEEEEENDEEEEAKIEIGPLVGEESNIDENESVLNDEYLFESNRIKKLYVDTNANVKINTNTNNNNNNKNRKITSNDLNKDSYQTTPTGNFTKSYPISSLPVENKYFLSLNTSIITTKTTTTTNTSSTLNNFSKFKTTTTTTTTGSSSNTNRKSNANATTLTTTITKILLTSTKHNNRLPPLVTSQVNSLKFVATQAEPLYSPSVLNDYVFKVKILAEDNKTLSEFELNVSCKKMSSTNSINNGLNDGNSSFAGLIMTCICAIVIIIVGSVFCLFIKRKYGLTPDYFLNLKNNLPFRVPNRSNLNGGPSNGHANGTNGNIHTSSNLAKRSKLQTYHHQAQQYQLETKTASGLNNNNNANNAHTNTTNLINTGNLSTKNSTFNYNYEDNDSIAVDLFESYVQKMHVDGDFGFAQLYEEITAITKTYSYSSDVALLDCNRCKNRYSNILTYDHSRVKLSCDERDESGGYVNANYVDGYQKPNAYIATQGPMPNTFGDFWRMIWEKNCSIIVMITNVKEKGRIKCDQYWPEEGAEYYSNIQVTHLHTITVAFYTKRIFTIKLKSSKKRCNSERLVYQFHFTDWPDHGVPYYIMPVLSFIKKSSRANPEFGGPIVVHCSAGVGRTGTYIVIDSMIKQIKNKCTVNIHTFLKHIRHQRNYLVQTEEQFIFIYDALLEAIKSGETELNEHNYKTYLDTLSTVINEEGTMLIDRQFELICEYKPNDYQVSFAQLACNVAKNRNQKIIPVNNSRVILSKNPTIDGSEYINATYLHGCNRQDEFIITQYPTQETRCNFWQMVWDNNSNQIVVLNSDETETCEPYWLPLGEMMKCDSFTVMLREENFDMDFVLRDFLLQSIDEDYEFNCRMITACYWPDSCTPIKSAFDLVNKVKMFRLQSIASNTSSNVSNNNPLTSASAAAAASAANLPPLIVHDLCGSHRAATFCALYTLQDLIHLESSVNVYETAKMFHLKRPGIWASKTNIMFLYGAVEYLFDEMHSNNHYQFRNYLNLNIDNHFHNLLYSSHHYYNQSPLHANNGSSNAAANANHVSLTLLPNSKMHQNNSLNSQTTVTLPNITSTSSTNHPNAKYGTNTLSNQRHNMSINEAIGTRLHNFQSHIQQGRVQSALDMVDPCSTIPLTSSNIQVSKMGIDSVANQSNNLLKTSLIDIPRILPSFFGNDSKQVNTTLNNSKMPIANRRSTSANYRNSKAIKFMNTMRMKSVSFKRALFPNSSMNQKQQTAAAVAAASAATTVTQIQSATINQLQLQQQPAKTLEHDELSKKDEQKPPVIISISSGSSSATTSSSSTALSSTPITATESISFKSAFVSANQIINPNSCATSILNNLNGNKSLSREKLT